VPDITHAQAMPLRPPFAELDVGANHVTLLKDGGQVFPALLDALRAARSTICLEVYTLCEDFVGCEVAEILKDRARAGVEVSLLLDAFGSSRLSRAFLDELHEAGVRTLSFNPVQLLSLPLPSRLGRAFRRDHRKLATVDGRVGFVCGQNLAAPYAAAEDGGGGWRDTGVRIEGPAVCELQACFLRLWSLSGGAAPAAERYLESEPCGDRAIWFVAGLRLFGRHTLMRMYRDAIRGARRRIWLTSAYFLPLPGLIRELRRAARRGIEVRVVLAGRTDVRSLLWAAWAIYGKLLKSGVRVYEWWGACALHAKTAVIDGQWSTVGSANLDAQSLKRSLELNVVIEDAAFAAEMERMFQEDLEHCHEIRLEDWKSWPYWKRAVAWVFYLFRDRL
jgi:cardiolipin synthase A/B